MQSAVEAQTGRQTRGRESTGKETSIPAPGGAAVATQYGQAWTKAVMRRVCLAPEHTPPLAKRPSGAINQPERAQRACSHDVEKAASAMDGSGE